jgi:hypothetical protein
MHRRVVQLGTERASSRCSASSIGRVAGVVGADGQLGAVAALGSGACGSEVSWATWRSLAVSPHLVSDSEYNWVATAGRLEPG